MKVFTLLAIVVICLLIAELIHMDVAIQAASSIDLAGDQATVDYGTLSQAEQTPQVALEPAPEATTDIVDVTAE